jgi:adenylate/guanylate cyclase family protein
LPEIHLDFARALIRRAGEHNATNKCELFDADGWCNCHTNYNLRIGVTEGKSVVYQDLNGGYNIAGDAVNMAARVMGQAERNQVLLSDHAYSQLVDLVDDAALAEKFRSFDNVTVKHGVQLTVHQYANDADEYLNTQQPEVLAIGSELESVMESMGGPFAPPGADKAAQGRALLEMFKTLEAMREELKPSVKEASDDDPKSGD